MTPYKLSKVGRLTALISFLAGTGIFVLYYLTDAYQFLFLGYGFIVLAGLVNIVIFVQLLRQLRKSNGNRKNMLLTCGLMLLNLPVLLTYCWVTTVLLNTMRITFMNETSTQLTDIKVFGCDTHYLEKLDPGESKKVWVKIAGDCTINIEFSINGKRQSENVADYVTNNMGQRMTHKIGWENGPAIY